MALRGLLPGIGRRSLARLLVQNVTHAAIGRATWGDPLNPPGEDFAATAMGDEIGRVPIAAVHYLIPDNAGTINFTREDNSTDGPYRYATTGEIAAAAALVPPVAPSADVLFEFTIPPNSANGQNVCQVGLFANGVTTVNSWATGGQITTVGSLVYLANIKLKAIETDDEFTRKVRVSL